jgi:hypothetical protein
MSKKIFMDAFYGQFSSFLDQLIVTFPDDSDFPTYKSGLFLLQKTNPKLVPEQVVLHVAPFERTIRNGTMPSSRHGASPSMPRIMPSTSSFRR